MRKNIMSFVAKGYRQAKQNVAVYEIGDKKAGDNEILLIDGYIIKTTIK
jgi:hypothetical protein